MDDQNKNLILAVALSGIVLLAWQVFFPAPTQTTAVETTQLSQPTDSAAPLLPPSTDAGVQASTDTPSPTAATAERITIDTDRLQGSLSLAGGRIDDLSLKDYTVDLDSDEIVTLLEPVGAESPYYAVYGWAPAGDLPQEYVPNANTIWSVEEGDVLTQTTPITLVWDNDNGMIFRRTIAIDDEYMFSVEQSVENTSAAPVRLSPYGIVARHGTPDVSGYFVLHEGLILQSDDSYEKETYKKIAKFDMNAAEGGNTSKYTSEENGWIGFTDKNWMTTLVPQPGQAFTSVAKYVPTKDTYQIESRLPVQEVAAGATVTSKTYLFAGAKEWEAIKGYQDDLGIHRFIYSIDWGLFFFFTQPIFRLLHAINLLIGNMGWSIIALTLLIKGIMFPLAYKSYVSMARMKELQPEMEKMKADAGEDREKLQKGMMELYKKNKVNPASGCLPLLLQIPVFFSLYKVIFVTIELRHAPWLGWIRDLSAPDPSSILNLFGLLSFSPPDPSSILAFISLGILPILLGISMWLQQKLNPAPTDPAQAMIFAWMPWVFMFMLGSFASGLVLYWITNNTITFIQQYLIMRSHGHKPDLFGNIARSLRLKKKEGSA
ncbi:protein translocase subunit yidC [Pacificibacter maritimus]|uniref:Membrane protein insertase YidC n=1 Tax=Pacificibacter maritimus TaxID=762213 RepID=A0A3N4URK4_9RHOB|nr:membrane protein insertase YidC [Pacificibacter maritimus]RPE63314.1 protein translocase subunit yidC [Pacificibacter maritimus]